MGRMFLRIKDEYTFSVAGRGAFKLMLNDQVVLEGSGDDLAASIGDEIAADQVEEGGERSSCRVHQPGRRGCVGSAVLGEQRVHFRIGFAAGVDACGR